MHTEKPEAFLSSPIFAPYRSQVRLLKDGERVGLDKL